MEKENAIETFGFDPEQVGLRNRGWWIVDGIGEREETAGAQVGDLCVYTRDGASNPPDPEAFRKENYRGTAQDDFDCTFRYYYFKPLSPNPRR